jgi:hypothetical protein
MTGLGDRRELLFKLQVLQKVPFSHMLQQTRSRVVSTLDVLAKLNFNKVNAKAMLHQDLGGLWSHFVSVVPE